MKISIIMPAYNEERRIGRTLEEYGKFFSKKKENKEIEDFEIVVVINNTKDMTEKVVQMCSLKSEGILCLNFKQGGKGFAITEGFKDALKRDSNLIGFVDADMSTPPEEYWNLIQNLNRYDGVIASRWVKGAKKRMSLKRRITSRGFNFIVRSMFMIPYRDTQCGAKLFRREVIEELTEELKLTQWAFDVNLLYLCRKKGFRIKEWPTVWEEDKRTKMASIPKVSVQMFSGVLRLRLIYSIFERILGPVKFILSVGDKILNKK